MYLSQDTKCERIYTVADHAFGLIMTELASAWGKMSNYFPFESTSYRTKLFTLSICDKVSLEDAIPIIVNHDKRSDTYRLDVYRTSEDYLFELRLPLTSHAGGRLRISNDFRSAEIALSGNESECCSALNRALMLCYLLATADKDTLLMHASTVISDGYAYLFLGKSGTGKSTHSNLWLHYISRVELLNDDHPVVRINTDGQVMVYGSPWSGKTPCYRNVSAPVGGIIRIRQAKRNYIRRLNHIESYASLMPSCSGMSWDSGLATGRSHSLQQLTSSIPCWILECLPDEAAARLCSETVRKEALCNG